MTTTGNNHIDSKELRKNLTEKQYNFLIQSASNLPKLDPNNPYGFDIDFDPAGTIDYTKYVPYEGKFKRETNKLEYIRNRSMGISHDSLSTDKLDIKAWLKYIYFANKYKPPVEILRGYLSMAFIPTSIISLVFITLGGLIIACSILGMVVGASVALVFIIAAPATLWTCYFVATTTYKINPTAVFYRDFYLPEHDDMNVVSCNEQHSDIGLAYIRVDSPNKNPTRYGYPNKN